MNANDDLILKDKYLDITYKQLQFDYENSKISDNNYLCSLKELHVKLFVHIKDVKNYHDSDSRLIPINTLEQRSEEIEKKVNLIINKHFPQTQQQKRIKNQIKQFAKQSSKEKVIEIFTSNNNSRRFGIKLTNDNSEYVDFDNQFQPLNFPNSAFNILEKLVSKNKESLKVWANLYNDNERDFYFFIYDLSAHAFFLDQLPVQFEKLKKIDGSYENLLHNRVIAQLAVQYQNQGNTIDYEIKNEKNKRPDLHVNTRDLEVKSIVSNGINHPDHFTRFSKSIRNRFLEAEKQIFLDKDMIVIVPWSQIMTNVLKTYFDGLYSKTLPPFREGKTILLLEGQTPFEDFYLELNSTDICDYIREFAESGYKRISPLSYLNSIRRKGFAVTRSGNSLSGFGISLRIR